MDDLNSLICCLVFYLVAIATFAVCLLIIYMFATTDKHPPNQRFDSEKYYLSAQGSKEVFPSINSEPSVDLTVVVPSYNEEDRLPAMLDEAIEFLEGITKVNRAYKYEIIVVDDGSRDKTSEVAMKYSRKYGTEKIRVLTLEKNRGKGGAVRLGVQSSRGRLVLFADADGATTFAEISKMLDEMSASQEQGQKDVVICGSRAHLEKESIAQRSLFRTILMKGFHFVVWFFCVRGVQDTQCGFKLMTRSAAHQLFTRLHVQRWAFDVEMLFIAQSMGMTIKEVAVRWQEIEGSKMVPVWSWLQMARDLMFIRLRYTLGLWKISKVE